MTTNDLLKKRVEENIGNIVVIFLKNNFRFEGKITNRDDKYLEILDFKTSSYNVLNMEDIMNFELKNGN